MLHRIVGSDKVVHVCLTYHPKLFVIMPLDRLLARNARVWLGFIIEMIISKSRNFDLTPSFLCESRVFKFKYAKLLEIGNFT
jgi:hypothetical protein